MKNIENPDSDLSRQFNTLLDEQLFKTTVEDFTRNASYGLEMLLMEKKINSETKLEEVVEVIEKRIKELQRDLALADSVAKSPASEETDKEFHNIAKNEAEKTARMLKYMDITFEVLDKLKEQGFDQDTSVSLIQATLEKRLERIEKAMDKNETEKRGE